MFSRLFAVLPLAALVAVAAAAPNALEARNDDSSCDVSDQACCDTTQLASGTTYDFGLSILGDFLSGIEAAAGVTCTPITVLGLSSGAQCTQQAVCCDNNTFNGLVNVACTPINVNA